MLLGNYEPPPRLCEPCEREFPSSLRISVRKTITIFLSSKKPIELIQIKRGKLF